MGRAFLFFYWSIFLPSVVQGNPKPSSNHSANDQTSSLSDLIGASSTSVRVITQVPLSGSLVNSLEIAKYRRLGVKVLYLGPKNKPLSLVYYVPRTRAIRKRAQGLLNGLGTTIAVYLDDKLYILVEPKVASNGLESYLSYPVGNSLARQIKSLFFKKSLVRYKHRLRRVSSRSRKIYKLPKLPKYYGKE